MFRTNYWILVSCFILFSCSPSKERQDDGTTNASLVSDELVVSSPLIDATVSSPLHITGKAKGPWYFEGRFSIVLKDNEGNVLGETAALADEEWMTEGWVNFDATLEFSDPNEQNGHIVFEKDNPSGRPENSVSYHIPVQFSR